MFQVLIFDKDGLVMEGRPMTWEEAQGQANHLCAIVDSEDLWPTIGYETSLRLPSEWKHSRHNIIIKVARTEDPA